MLEDEFGSSKDEDVVQQILEKGTIVETEVRPFGRERYARAVINTSIGEGPSGRPQHHLWSVSRPLMQHISSGMIHDVMTDATGNSRHKALRRMMPRSLGCRTVVLDQSHAAARDVSLCLPSEVQLWSSREL